MTNPHTKHITAATQAERIAGACNAAYWLGCNGLDAAVKHREKSAREALRKLAQALGCRMSLDDTGTDRTRAAFYLSWLADTYPDLRETFGAIADFLGAAREDATSAADGIGKALVEDCGASVFDPDAGNDAEKIGEAVTKLHRAAEASEVAAE